MEANTPNNLIMIRHGESTFNRTYLDFLSDHNIDPAKTTWEDSHSLPGFKETVAYVEQNIDAPLTPHGIQQCQATRQLLQDEQVDLVLVSPYQRAL